jgi:uncharacterized Zn finger protein
MTKELKDCPKCGDDDLFTAVTFSGRIQIECLNCGHTGKSVLMGSPISETLAIKAWNGEIKGVSR